MAFTFSAELDIDLTAQNEIPAVYTEQFENGTAVLIEMNHVRVHLIGGPAELREVAQAILEMVLNPMWIDGISFEALDEDFNE